MKNLDSSPFSLLGLRGSYERLTETNGEPPKRIVSTLTTESSGGSRLTYEKGLLNSRKK